MSELLKRYEESKKLRVEQAKQIPSLATDFFDKITKFAKGFTTFERRGNITNYTEGALKHFNVEHSEIVIPEGFVPLEEGMPLSRWTPDNKYYNPGQGR